MFNIKKIILIILYLLCVKPIFSQSEGYYKDLFMDGGVGLYSKEYFYAADSLGLQMEYFASEDSLIQSILFVGDANDQNGRLLYPDGAPRFKQLYTNGGKSTTHGLSLGTEGRNRIRDYYANGGSFSGSCAGAHITAVSYLSTDTIEAYYHIWPGRTQRTNQPSTYTGHFIPKNSPLLKYYSFGGDLYVDNVYHLLGPLAREDIDFPEGTEILLRFDYSDNETMHQKVSSWAYKKDLKSGRLVVIGSHPEKVDSGERLNLMEAILLYAMDGAGEPQIKGTLTKGETRVMDKNTSDNDPSFTKIGDLQYHHYLVHVPSGAKNFQITLSADDAYDMNLYFEKNNFAFDGNAEFSEVNEGGNKILVFPEIESGTWYIGVKCASTIQTFQQSWGSSYAGDLSVLNGVQYAITVDWDSTTTDVILSQDMLTEFELLQNYPNPFNPSTTFSFSIPSNEFVTLAIYNSLGQQVATIVNSNMTEGSYKFSWNANKMTSGVYFAQLNAGNKTQIQKIMLLK
jgi:hypothetical protein